VIAVTADSAGHAAIPPYQDEDEIPLDELARRQGVPPVHYVHEMARPDLFASDEEADEFVAYVTASRHADLG
jgi:hypothetical protein